MEGLRKTWLRQAADGVLEKGLWQRGVLFWTRPGQNHWVALSMRKVLGLIRIQTAFLILAALSKWSQITGASLTK